MFLVWLTPTIFVKTCLLFQFTSFFVETPLWCLRPLAASSRLDLAGPHSHHVAAEPAVTGCFQSSSSPKNFSLKLDWPWKRQQISFNSIRIYIHVDPVWANFNYFHLLSRKRGGFPAGHALLPQGIKIRIPKYDCNSTMTMNRTASQLATAIIRPSMTRASRNSGPNNQNKLPKPCSVFMSPFSHCFAYLCCSSLHGIKLHLRW